MNLKYLLIIDFPKFYPLTAADMALCVNLGPKCQNLFPLPNLTFYGDIFRANFFDLKNSKNRQNNGDLEPLKDFGTNFFRSNHPLKYLNLS
jgi:hypothetical protein